MKKRKTPKDVMKQKLKKLNEATEAIKKYAAVVPLSPLSPVDLVAHDLKEMGEAQDNFIRCCDAVFKKEQ